VIFGAAVALLLGAGAIWTWLVPATSELHSPMRWLASLEGARELSDGNVDARHAYLLRGLVIAGGTAAVASVLLALANTRRRVVLLLGLTVLELCLFVAWTRESSPTTASLAGREDLAQAYPRMAPNRILEAQRSNNVALGVRGYGVWGYDPVVLDRYATFVAATQGERGGARLPWGIRTTIGSSRIFGRFRSPTSMRALRFHSALAMLRLQAHWLPGEGIRLLDDPVGTFLLIRDYRVAADPEVALLATLDAGFDPRRVVILEARPDLPRVPASAPAPRDRVRVIGQSTDHYDLEVDVQTRTILVITDAYSSGWRAVPLPGSSQASYQLLPANYVLRGVPLAPGRHRLRVEYAPFAQRAGIAISAVSGVAFLAAVFVAWRRRVSR
jgi:hypothetical protein